MARMHRLLFVLLGLLALGWPLSAQWTNRYQRIGQGHHVYVEGYDFPTYSVGPTYPAVSPDGATIAFSARGWLWTMRAGGRTGGTDHKRRGDGFQACVAP
jgi:TolB protein